MEGAAIDPTEPPPVLSVLSVPLLVGCPAALLLFPGVELVVSFLQVSDGQAQIPLRGRQGLVAKHLLDATQVGVVLDQVRGTRVPPQVAGDVFLEPELAYVTVEDAL